MLQLSLDGESSMPLVDQIVTGIRSHIDDRVLRSGMRLPPIRSFAEKHAISRFTVVEAYDRLVALGYVSSRRGSGFYVTGRAQHDTPELRSGELERAFDNAGVMYQSLEDTTDRLRSVSAGCRANGWTKKACAATCAPRPAQRPARHFLWHRARLPATARATADQARRLRHRRSNRSDPPHPWRHTGTRHHCRTLIQPGDCVLVDDPGYWNLFANLRLYGANLVGVPRTASGPDPDALAALLAEHRPKAFFTHSVLHNPTSGNLSPATAFRVPQLARSTISLIVEDDAYGDFHPGPATRLAQLDQLETGDLRRQLRQDAVGRRPGRLPRLRPLICAARFSDVKIVSAFRVRSSPNVWFT